MRILAYTMLIAVALLMTACHDSENNTPASGEASLQFYVMNFEQSNMDKIKTRTTEATALAHLSLGIYDAKTHQLVQDVETQNASDNNEKYGSFSVSLPYGEYVLIFLGYDGSRLANMENPQAIVFADEYVPNLFCKTITLKLDPNTPQTQAVTLSRAVACFSLTCDGDIPSTLQKMVFTAQGGSGSLNGITGYATQAEERTYTYLSVSSYAGKTKMDINLYTFLPSEESTMNFVVTALDNEDNVIKCRTFNGVPMKINQRSHYTGNFFTTDSFSLLLENNVWDEQTFTY